MNVLDALAQMNALEPPAPVTLEVSAVNLELALNHLEETNALPEVAHELRWVLSQPKVELYGAFTHGAGEFFATLTKEDAQQIVDDFRKEWCPPGGWRSPEAFEVVRSPLTPANHYQLIAMERTQRLDELIDLIKRERAEAEALKQRNALLEALADAVDPNVIDWVLCGLATNGRLTDGSHPALKKLEKAYRELSECRTKKESKE